VLSQPAGLLHRPPPVCSGAPLPGISEAPEPHSASFSVIEPSSHSDHCVIAMTMASSSTLPSGRRPRPWSPGFPRVDRASLLQRQAIALACNKVASRFLARWKGAAARSEVVLEGRCRPMLFAMRSEASRVLSKGQRRDEASDRQLGPVALVRMRIEALFSLQHSIREVLAGSRDPGSRPHRHAHGRVQELLGRPLHGCPKHYNLAALSAELKAEMTTQRAALDDAWACASTATRREKDTARLCFLADQRAWINRFTL
jgi:hypothetical protein